MLKFRTDYPIMLIMTIMALAFSFVFSLSQNDAIQMQKIGIINESQSRFADEVVGKIHQSGEYNVIIATKEEMRGYLKDLDVPFALYLSPEFDLNHRDLLIYRSIETMEGIQAENKLINLINQIALTDRVVVGIATGIPGINEAELKSTFDHELQYWPTYSMTMSSIGEGVWQDFDFMMHLLIGFSVMFSMYTMIFGMGDILTDRKLLTFQRIMVSPIKKHQFVFGNLIASMFFGFVQMVIVLTAGQYLFNIDWGQYLIGILAVVLSFIFAISAFGLLLTNVVKTMGQLGAITPIVITGTAMLGGCMWPLEIVNSKLLLTLSDFTPQKWAMVGIKNLAMYDMAISSIIKPIGILILMGIVFLAVGIYLLDKSELRFSH
jgi:ABC-2 type transport system permease protein